MRTVLISITLLVALSVLAVWSLGRGALGRHDSETLTPVSAVRSPESVAHAAKVQRAAADALRSQLAEARGAAESWATERRRLEEEAAAQGISLEHLKAELEAEEGGGVAR